jgi:hypothetical protein
MSMIEPMGLNVAHLDVGEKPHLAFCAREYRTRNWSIACSGEAPVIVLVLRNTEGALRFLVHP